MHQISHRKEKYNFKSYFAPKIFEDLQKWKTRNASLPLFDAAMENLYRALEEYFSKETYYEAFSRACQPNTAAQANLPMAQRAAMPDRIQGTAMFPEAPDDVIVTTQQ